MTDNEKSRAEWTVMVYMAADNNLDIEAIKDLEVMKTVGSSKNVNVVAQYDSAMNRGASRLFLRKGTLIHEDIVEKLQETNTGDPNALAGFIDWAMTKYPSEKTLLVLWGHGHGWLSNDRKNPVLGGPVLGFLYDDHPGDNSSKTEDVLRMDEFRNALKKGIKGKKTKIDVLGMDACMMGMIEVGYQIRDYVEYMVASEDPIPNEGWPYCRILKRLTECPGMTPEQLARIITREYLCFYLEKGKDSVYSVTKLENMESLVKSLSQLAEALIEKLNKDDSNIRAEVFAARAKTQHYFIDDYVDLHHFCWNLSRFSSDEKVKMLSKNVMNKIRYVIDSPSSADLVKEFDTNYNFATEYGFVGYRLRNSKGISIYFPCIPPMEEYNDSLEFVKRSKWDELLCKLTEVFSKSAFSSKESELSNGLYYLSSSRNNLQKTCEGTEERDCFGAALRIPADPLI